MHGILCVRAGEEYKIADRMDALVFLSHRSIDKPRIRNFVLRLADRRIPVWIDNFEEFNVRLPPDQPRIERAMLAGVIEPGTSWPDAIDQALLRASIIVVFWSNAWSQHRAVLAQEHGVALVRHRAGQVRYIPVFLDDEPTLDDDLKRYRVGVGDDVQAFNVARYGHEQWNRLLEAITAACHSPLTGSAGAGDPRETADWMKVVIRVERNDDEILEAVLKMPLGPAVDAFAISLDIKQRFARATTPMLAREMVNRASSIVLQSLSPSPQNPHAFALQPADLRAPEFGLVDYWAEAFDQACLLGPRMVAALLLVAPPGAMSGAESKFANVLEKLEKKP